MLIELIDQMTRTHSGGEMEKYWKSDLCDRKYVNERTGFPAGYEREPKGLYKPYISVRNLIVGMIPNLKFIKQWKAGRFSLNGELHKWMYDSYSLTSLLEEVGFKSVELKTYNESRIVDWSQYMLEVNEDGNEYKVNCIYMEGMK